MKIQIDDEIRNANAGELAQIKVIQDDAAANLIEKQNRIDAKETAKEKLQALGLTADEVKLLLG